MIERTRTTVNEINCTKSFNCSYNINKKVVKHYKKFSNNPEK
jgi:hypothetical protein